MKRCAILFLGTLFLAGCDGDRVLWNSNNKIPDPQKRVFWDSKGKMQQNDRKVWTNAEGTDVVR
ncbi:MAG: hypothetical protein LPK85_01130 [Gammaproteobacteria bacterium]|nr:hypothetical protein [Gammaproteobacteria bacterium]